MSGFGHLFCFFLVIFGFLTEHGGQSVEYPTQQQLVDAKYLPSYLSRYYDDKDPAAEGHVIRNGDDHTLRIWMSRNLDKGRELMHLDRRQGYRDFVYEHRTKRKVFERETADDGIATSEYIQSLRLPARAAKVATLLIAGHRRKDIAQALGVHARTIRRDIQIIKQHISGNMPVLHCKTCGYACMDDWALADHVHRVHHLAGQPDIERWFRKAAHDRPRGKEMGHPG